MNDRVTCPRCERSVSVVPDRKGEAYVLPHDTRAGILCQESYATAPVPYTPEVPLRIVLDFERKAVEVRTDHPKPCCEDYCPLCGGAA
jgi:hypothetical protein